MGRSKRTKERAKRFEIKEETRHGVLAVIFFVLAVFLLLASLNYAGPAGALVYKALKLVFGLGFFLFPLVLFILGVVLLQKLRPQALGLVTLGGAIFFLGGLGLLHSLFAGSAEGGAGGFIGWVLAQPILALFDRPIALVFFGAVMLIASLIIFDTNLTLEKRLFGFAWGKDRQAAKGDSDEFEDYADTLPTTEPIETAAEEVEPEPEVKTETKANDQAEGGSLFEWKSRRRQHRKFKPPPLNLLEHDIGKPVAGDIKASANIIKRTLANFGIPVEMDEISIGPAFTRYALKPAEGIKLSRILTLQNDLSLALAAHPLRIEAPIPGQALVGIEVPNRARSTVGLAALVDSPAYQKSPLSLLISLGRDISGTPHFANLGRAPHLLIAGSTGSGKSVVIHTLITSLLYRNSPEMTRFILIDPKRVELTLYNKIPHLLTPVITDAKKAISALKWATGEMERRYEVLEKERVRDIDSYHKNVKDGEAMPYIVIVIDELADIMTSYPRELEAVVIRLAQMSRAVGIHLVLSTQRPSVEIITGLIKANIPTRIALQVASQIDSRTILDMPGAEKLLGAGDMLYLSGERSKPARLQAAFISETEVKKVVDWLADNYDEDDSDELTLAEEELEAKVSWEGDGQSDDDELYQDAKKVVLESGRASASFLQRRLKVGYARAARLLDMLEENGLIGPGEGAKPREVFHPISPATDGPTPQSGFGHTGGSNGLDTDEQAER